MNYKYMKEPPLRNAAAVFLYLRYFYFDRLSVTPVVTTCVNPETAYLCGFCAFGDAMTGYSEKSGGRNEELRMRNQEIF